jgi:hypothetical protein
MMAIRPTGEPVFKVIDHNNWKQLDRLDNFPYATPAWRVKGLHSSLHRRNETNFSETSRPKVYAQGAVVLVDGRQSLDKAETRKHGS